MTEGAYVIYQWRTKSNQKAINKSINLTSLTVAILAYDNLLLSDPNTSQTNITQFFYFLIIILKILSNYGTLFFRIKL